MADDKFKPLTIEPVNFSLTAGTNIPSPPDSPPPTPGADKPTDDSTDPKTPSKVPGAPPTPIEVTNNKTPGSKDNKLPISPVSETSEQKKRLSGVRKFLSFRPLRGDKRQNSSKTSSKSESKDSTDQQAAVAVPAGRPGSPNTTHTVTSAGTESSHPSLQRKRSSGWFASAGRRKSTMFLIGRVDEKMDEADEETEAQKKLRMGPPPPTIPEFFEFKSLEAEMENGDTGAGDIFKDIK